MLGSLMRVDFPSNTNCAVESQKHFQKWADKMLKKFNFLKFYCAVKIVWNVQLLYLHCTFHWVNNLNALQNRVKNSLVCGFKPQGRHCVVFRSDITEKFLTGMWGMIRIKSNQIKSRYWYLKIIFLISQPKHMFWVLKRTICCGCSKEPSHWDGSFEHP